MDETLILKIVFHYDTVLDHHWFWPWIPAHFIWHLIYLSEGWIYLTELLWRAKSQNNVGSKQQNLLYHANKFPLLELLHPFRQDRKHIKENVYGLISIEIPKRKRTTLLEKRKVYFLPIAPNNCFNGATMEAIFRLQTCISGITLIYRGTYIFTRVRHKMLETMYTCILKIQRLIFEGNKRKAIKSLYPCCFDVDKSFRTHTSVTVDPINKKIDETLNVVKYKEM